MREIKTLEELEEVCHNFEGILIAVPNNPLLFNAEFYVIKKAVTYTNEEYYSTSGYNVEDETVNGFSMDGLKESFRQLTIDFHSMNYYHFKDFKELCQWYLENECKRIKAIDNFIKETDKFYKKDLIPKEIREDITFAEINKLPITAVEKLKLYNKLKMREKHAQAIFNLYETVMKEQKPFEVVNKEKAREQLHDLNREMISWEMYNDPRCDEKIKDVILEEYPNFKEKLFKMDKEENDAESNEEVNKEWIQEKCGTNTPPTSVPEEPSKGNKKCEEFKITRREKLEDVIILLGYLKELEYNKNKINTYHPLQIPQWIADETIQIEKEMNEWLDEEIDV